VEMVQTYLTIEKIRFEERLQFTIEAADEVRTALMPRFILQPLAENCIKHGFNQQAIACQITIVVGQTHQRLQIIVADNGAPFAADMQPGYGLQGIYQKLQLLYPDRHEIRFNNQPKQIEITILQDGA
jgi:LytS/YehU family sensor histidine kinase